MIQNNDFKLEVIDLHWINNIDDPTDLCAHGHDFVKIGNEIICDKNSIDITVSSTALYLMRTLESNYTKGDYSSQFLPCCGHFFIANESQDYVNIMGCLNGIDWTIIHTENGKIRHITEKGNEAIIEKVEYQKIVLEFVNKVDYFYKSSLPKIVPTDDFGKNGYLTFWNEWKSLLNQWK